MEHHIFESAVSALPRVFSGAEMTGNPVTPLLIFLGSCFAIGLLVTFIVSWRERRHPSYQRQVLEQEVTAAFGMQCPHCSARLSEQRGGSWEHRHCVICGNKFELRD